MRNRPLLSALAVCFLAAGCDSKKPAEPAPPKPVTAAVVPVPAASQPSAAPANPDARPAAAQADAPKAGGAAPAKGNGRKGCGQGNCKVTIDVMEGQTPCAKANPDKLDVFRNNKNDHIRWSLNGASGWKFTASGIEWKDSGQNQFSDGGPEAGGDKFKWKNANTDEKEYRYTIHLVKGKAKCDVDPSAINGADELAQ
jgi:hypothetical protein